jgi:hypothetical protein
MRILIHFQMKWSFWLTDCVFHQTSLKCQYFRLWELLFCCKLQFPYCDSAHEREGGETATKAYFTLQSHHLPCGRYANIKYRRHDSIQELNLDPVQTEVYYQPKTVCTFHSCPEFLKHYSM